MRITNQILHDTITEVVGQDAIPVVEYIKSRKNISEFKVAEALQWDINSIRRILYKLFDNSLCTYNRKKDSKKGWYISYWTFNIKRIKYVIDTMKKRKLDVLKERLEKELKAENNFYLCPNFCFRTTFDDASEIDFKCPECGKVLNHQDNTRTIEQLKEQIKELS